MRTIEMREHEKKKEHLSSDEVSQLLRVGIVDLAPTTGADEWELATKSKVGTVDLPSLRLLVRPKVGIENLFYLLGFGAGLTEWAREQFPYEREGDLFKAVAWVFEAEVRRALAQGIVRGYRSHLETLTTLRGRIDMAGQLRARQGRPFPLECSFEDYTEDVELNRVLKATHRRLLSFPSLYPGLRRGLRHNGRAFENVATVEYASGFVPKLNFTRLDRHWEAAGRVAQLVLRQQSLRDREGNVIGTAFTVDMNKLFERFVEAIVREEAYREGWELLAQDVSPLTEKSDTALMKEVRIEPDLVLRRRGGRRKFAVGDAKYKVLAPGKWLREDLYQLLAYCSVLGLPKGLLIYASEHPPETYTVRQVGIGLEIVGINMDAGPSEIEAQARGAARRLVEQATEFLARRQTQA